MYAVFRSGGKQYKVAAGDSVRIEKVDGDVGSELQLSEILMVGGKKSFIGEPTLDKAQVTALVTNQARAPKIIVFKKKRRQGYRKMQGHRQSYTELFIKKITSPDGDSSQAEKSKTVAAKPSSAATSTAKKVVKKVTKKAADSKTLNTKKKVAKKSVTKKATAKKSVTKKATAKKKTTKKK